ncbi:flavin reductase family protein [Treponema sp.]|uniref:flavin reductase family protein n=1 Tax=Treponema sp. TaxID=166 RepID=UPI003F073D8A
MRKNFGPKEWLYPMPVLIIGTYDENGKPDAMNAAWGSISDDRQIGICLSPTHKTVKNIMSRKAFTVSVGTEKLVKECDYFGVVSANEDPCKFEKSGLHEQKSEFADAPLIQEFPFVLECKLISYDEKSCHLFGEILNISIDDSVLDAEGKVDVKKLAPIAYDPVNKNYLKLGDPAGKAFCIGLELKA